jgi:hypothetical protein
MTTSVLLGAWMAAGLTLFMYSFLYRDNFFFKLGEHLFIGISVGYTIVIMFFEYVLKKWWGPLFVDHKFILIIPTLLGVGILTRFSPKYSWLSRWAFAFIFGMGAGMAIPRTISTYLLAQVEGTVVPLISKTEGKLTFSWADFSNLLVFLGVLSTLIYFFFSVEHKGAIKAISRLGIFFLMISFGASFGYTAMARMSLLFGRFYDLVFYSSRRYGYATLILLALIIGWFVITDFLGKKKKTVK